MTAAALVLAMVGGHRGRVGAVSAAEASRLVWSALPPLPDPIGVAGPFRAGP